MEAKKYTTRHDFLQGNHGAYTAARRNGWLKDYGWLDQPSIYPHGYWQSYEHCLNEAKKYKTRKKFHDGNVSAYTSSWRHKWLDDFFPKAKKNKG